MGVWDKIEAEDMSGSGNGIYFVPGKYPKLRLKESKFKSADETYKKSDVVIFILEVLESEVPDRKPGSEIEYIIKERKADGKPNTFYLKNIKKFLMAVFGTDDHTDIDRKVMDLVLGERQKGVGALLSAVATNIKIGEAQKDFTQVEFKKYEEAGKATSSARAEA